MKICIIMIFLKTNESFNKFYGYFRYIFMNDINEKIKILTAVKIHGIYFRKYKHKRLLKIR